MKIIKRVLAAFLLTILIGTNMNAQKNKYGIEGENAPAFDVPYWIDADGNESVQINLKDFDGQFKVIYCFQSWCPGCHSRGLPALQKMTKALSNNDDVVFLAVQTVFEGKHTNTKEKLLETQKKYNLKIPFGHDAGDDRTNNRSNIMYHYNTGGTPWFIFIDKNNKVVFNNFHLDVDKAIEFLKGI